jgi:RimJ/RimL family protein N-acetyltransferase
MLNLWLILYSTMGQAKSIQDTQRIMARIVSPPDAVDGDKQKYRYSYVIHRKIVDPVSTEQNEHEKTDVIGLISLRPGQTIPFPDSFSPPDGPTTGILKLELGYCLLPTVWRNGYATEAITGVLDSAKKYILDLVPFQRVYVEAAASPDNTGSWKALERAGLQKVGLYEWDGERIVLAGKLRECCVVVYGIWLVE